MSKRSQSPAPAPTHNGRPVALWGEPHPEPKWDLYIAALLAYALREVDGDGESAGEDDRG